MRRRRFAGALLGGFMAAALLLIAAGAWLVNANLSLYRRLNVEQAAGELQFSRIGYHQFTGVLTYPSGDSAEFELRGDEWQIDARVLKLRGWANFLGFDAAYRLDRIGGRYASIEDERSLPRTVYSLSPPERIDLWELARRYQSWLPWIDALYGSAAFLPMVDGARYAITVTESGLIARPINEAARTAVADWPRSP
jgi:hypothetical protein